MIIKNKNGQYDLNSSHYNWLTHWIMFNEIDSFIVEKTRFINSSWEYEKATCLLKDIINSGLYDINNLKFNPSSGMSVFDHPINNK